MVDFVAVNDGDTMDGPDVQQVIDSWQGANGKGVPLRQVSVDDATYYAGRFKNLDTTNKRVLRADDASGNALIDALGGSGVTLSPDGTNFGQTPDVLGLAQTISATKTFSAPQNWKYITSVASAAALTLPSTGNIFQITGTTNITSITAIAGARIILYFADALKVVDGSNLDLEGSFYSQAGAELGIWCDGTNWHDEHRKRNKIPLCSLYRSASVSIPDNANEAINWDAETADAFGFHAVSSEDIIPTEAGVYIVIAAITLDYDKDGARRLYLSKNGSEIGPGITISQGGNAVTGTPATALQLADVVAFNGTTDSLKVIVENIDSGAALDIQGGAAKTFAYLRWLGPE